MEFEKTCDNCNHYHDYSQRCTLNDCYTSREDACDDWNGHIPDDEEEYNYALLAKKLPNWEMNTIAPLRACKDKILCCGLLDANRRDVLLWFSNEEDIEYICKALNFYETYEPIFDEFLVMVHDLEQVLKTGSTKKKEKEQLQEKIEMDKNDFFISEAKRMTLLAFIEDNGLQKEYSEWERRIYDE